MPVKPFIVVEVPGMNLTANLDPRSKETGCIVLLHQGEKMDQFFSWYEDRIVIPFHRSLLSVCEQVSIDSESIPEDQHARCWIDSDMQQISRLTHHAVMEKNFSRGLPC